MAFLNCKFFQFSMNAGVLSGFFGKGAGNFDKWEFCEKILFIGLLFNNWLDSHFSQTLNCWFTCSFIPLWLTSFSLFFSEKLLMFFLIVLQYSHFHLNFIGLFSSLISWLALPISSLFIILWLTSVSLRFFKSILQFSPFAWWS
jgi:hypothetical protein